MSGYRPQFEEALRALARVNHELAERGLSVPILVGGAAVELYSASAIATGDFDLIASHYEALEATMLASGFVRPSGPMQSTRGWVHPDLQLGFEVVGSSVLEGMADPARLQIVSTKDGEIEVISIEDLIADRMSQFDSGTAPEFLEQAKILHQLHPDADMAYMERRIREETGNRYGIDDLS